MTLTNALFCALHAAVWSKPLGPHRRARNTSGSSFAGQVSSRLAPPSLCKEFQVCQRKNFSESRKALKYRRAVAQLSDASARQRVKQAWSNLPRWHGWRRTISLCCASFARTAHTLRQRARHGHYKFWAFCGSFAFIRTLASTCRHAPEAHKSLACQRSDSRIPAKPGLSLGIAPAAFLRADAPTRPAFQLRKLASQLYIAGPQSATALALIARQTTRIPKQA